MNPERGEVWLADLGIVAKTRPVVIVSRNDENLPRALAIYLPLTTQYRNSPYEVVLPNLRFLRQTSFVNVQGIGSIPLVRLEYCLGELPDSVMHDIDAALKLILDLQD
jgi:mRNA interferase MazF